MINLNDKDAAFNRFVGALILTVAAMREAQKSYFKTRDKKSLQDAKSLESEVDRLLNEIKPAIKKAFDIHEKS